MQGSSKVSPKKWMDRLFGQRRSDSLQEWNVEEEVKTDLYSPGWPDLRTIFLCLNLLMLFKSSLSRRGKDVKIWSVTLSCYHGRIPVGENYNLKDCSTRFNTGKNGFIGLEIEKRFQNRRTMVSNFQVWRKMKSAWSLTDVGRGVRKWEWGRSAGWGERQQWTEGSAVRVPCRPLIRMDPMCGGTILFISSKQSTKQIKYTRDFKRILHQNIVFIFQLQIIFHLVFIGINSSLVYLILNGIHLFWVLGVWFNL